MLTKDLANDCSIEILVSASKILASNMFSIATVLPPTRNEKTETTNKSVKVQNYRNTNVAAVVQADSCITRNLHRSRNIHATVSHKSDCAWP
jgi:hypothetical protein